jgi:hypothetical protein
MKQAAIAMGKHQRRMPPIAEVLEIVERMKQSLPSFIRSADCDGG